MNVIKIKLTMEMVTRLSFRQLQQFTLLKKVNLFHAKNRVFFLTMKHCLNLQRSGMQNIFL